MYFNCIPYAEIALFRSLFAQSDGHGQPHIKPDLETPLSIHEFRKTLGPGGAVW
jgi:hypothetical protein